MKIVIFGATGKTGIELVKQAIDKGHHVTAFIRNPDRLEIEDKNITLVTGDVFDPISVSQAIKGQDAVICALGSGSDLSKTTVRTAGTNNIIKSMNDHKIKRFIAVSAMGVGESWKNLSLLNKFFFAVLLKSSREDHEAQEAAIIASDLEWTIVRPSGLTEKPLTGVYEVGENISAKTSQIARADVADMILKELEQNVLIGKSVTISN